MSCASDRWIRAQCLGELHFELYYDDDFKGVHPLSVFDHDQIVKRQALIELKPGEERSFKGTGSTIKVKCVETLPPNGQPLISPFVESSVKHLDVSDETLHQVKVKCPSFGSSSYGYDIRPATRWKRLRHVPGGIVSTIDETGAGILLPKDYTEDVDAPYIDIPPLGCVLGVSIERIVMPDNVTAVCMAKSTLARLFLEAAVTPLEADWSGYITLEFFNKSPNTIRLWAGIGAMQLVFHVGNERCLVSYADRGGKYQNQAAEPVAAAF